MKGMSHFIRELQIKAMGYQYTCIKMAKIQNTANPKCWWRRGVTETHSLLVGIQAGIATLEDISAVSYKIKHILTICSDSFVPWHLFKVENVCLHTHTHTHTHTEHYT